MNQTPSPRPALTFRIILWVFAVGICALAAAMFLSPGGDAAGRGIGQGLGILLSFVGGAAIVTLVLGSRWRAFLWIAAAIVALPLLAVIAFYIFGMFHEVKYQQELADMASGRADFKNQPALLAVAQAIAKNDPEAIRAAAQKVPDLNAAGEDGKTLLYFAVDQAIEKPERLTAVETLLSLGADPNYNNGNINSFALWRSISAKVDVLRAMLDAGGDPNAPDFRGNPFIFFNWELTFNENDRPARFHLLLDRGTDVNTAYPVSAPILAGYSLVLARVNAGTIDHSGYNDALELLERGADPNHAAVDGTTVVRLIEAQRTEYEEWKTPAPPEFERLCAYLASRGPLSTPR